MADHGGFEGADFPDIGQSLLDWMRDVAGLDERARSAQGDPQRLRVILEESFGRQVLLRGLDRATVMDRLLEIAMTHDPNSSKSLAAECSEAIGQIAAKQVRPQQAAMLAAAMGLPDDFEERAMSLRTDMDGLRELLSSSFLSITREWPDEVRDAAVARLCRAVVDYDQASATPLVGECLKALAEVNDPSGRPIVRTVHIRQRVANLGKPLVLPPESGGP